MSYKVLICQNKTCKQQGSALVIKAFQRYQQRYNLPQDWVEASGCMGQCGNGPMVLALTDKTDAIATASTDPQNTHDSKTTEKKLINAETTACTWHSGVQAQDVWSIARRYSGLADSSDALAIGLEKARSKSSIWLWVSWVGLAAFFIGCILVAVFAARHSHYV